MLAIARNPWGMSWSWDEMWSLVVEPSSSGSFKALTIAKIATYTRIQIQFNYNQYTNKLVMSAIGMYECYTTRATW